MSVEFVDTNVFIYAHDVDMGAKQIRAIELIERTADGTTGAISVQVLIEFYSAATRKLDMTSISAVEIIQDLISLMTVHRPEPADVLRAAELQRRHKISWFDALILNSAIQLGCSTLWTEDLSDGQRYSSVTVRNPFK